MEMATLSVYFFKTAWDSNQWPTSTLLIFFSRRQLSISENDDLRRFGNGEICWDTKYLGWMTERSKNKTIGKHTGKWLFTEG